MLAQFVFASSALKLWLYAGKRLANRVSATMKHGEKVNFKFSLSQQGKHVCMWGRERGMTSFKTLFSS